ncbi:MAG: Holliday junction resolvase RuvX [Leadbetterella sp.]
MKRILAIDYGLKRCGIAATDPMQIIASPLETIETSKLLDYLRKYIETEPTETIILGLPLDLKSKDTDITSNVRRFKEILTTTFPSIRIEFEDERFTSKIASQSLFQMGKSTKNKADIDKISATLILQSYLDRPKI